MEVSDIILKFDREMKEANGGVNPLRKSIMGYYGEVIVANELRKRKIGFHEKGGLAGYDLFVSGKSRLEVRTSAIKNERAFPKSISAWGWKLQTRDRDKNPNPIKYDLIALVKLDEDWRKYDIFMFSKEEVEKMKDTYFGGYQTVARSIYLFSNPMAEAQRADKHGMITKECIAFNRHPEKFLVDWDRLL